MFPFASGSDTAQQGSAFFQDKETEGRSVNYTLKTPGSLRQKQNKPAQVPVLLVQASFPRWSSVLQKENLRYEFKGLNNQSPWKDIILK